MCLTGISEGPWKDETAAFEADGAVGIVDLEPVAAAEVEVALAIDEFFGDRFGGDGIVAGSCVVIRAQQRRESINLGNTPARPLLPAILE
jgi:hypothetical protein